MNQHELDFLTQQKIELLLSMKTKKFEEHITGLKQDIGMLQSQIAQLRQELSTKSQTAPVAREEPVVKDAEPEPAQPQPTLQQVAEPTPPPPAPVQKKEPHPKQGKYNSDDVSIEKYFNFSRR